MAEYEEAGYYEIQLNNKQLVFFFMAAVAIAVVVFLCGVMVGRGVRDAALAAGGTSIISGPGAGQSLKSAVAPADVRRELDFPQRLEADEAESRLADQVSNPEKLVASVTRSARPRDGARRAAESARPAAESPRTVAEIEPAPSPPSASDAEVPRSVAPALIGSERGAFTIQVVALKTEEAAESLVNRLKEARYRAYLEPGGSAGLYRVRVGRFESRSEAEQVATALRDVEKFKPYITQ